MSLQNTITAIIEAPGWAQRIAQLRLVPQRHGTGDHLAIYAEVARKLYLPSLSPDFAYVHPSEFYEPSHFNAAYASAERLTLGFTKVGESDIAAAINAVPATLLVFRTITGLGRDELAHATKLHCEPLGLAAVSKSTVQNMEQCPANQAGAKGWQAPSGILAATIAAVMQRSLFGAPPSGMRLKQDKPDTVDGWESVQKFAREGVPFSVFLHQRHYGGAFGQLLNATSSQRGDVIEDAVEALFTNADVHFIRTGAHNQAEVARRFEVRITPAPDFVVFDPEHDTLLAMLECKGANDGGTARDKALRFARLRAESIRLGGTPLFAVLSGIGWARVNDALAPVIRDCDGRVFTLSTLPEMLLVPPFQGYRRHQGPGERVST